MYFDHQDVLLIKKNLYTVVNICNPVRIFPIRGTVKNKQVDKLDMARLMQAMERSNQQSKRSNIMRRGFGAGRTVDGKIRILKRETAAKRKRRIQDGKIRILRRSQSFWEK